MKLSELRRAIVDEFGPGYGAVLERDLALRTLAGRTTLEAIADGVDAREIWLALCEEAEVPLGHRHGVGRPEPRRS